MSLDQKIASFLASADSRPAPSKLEPYAELIRELRRKRWTYLRIARTLKDEFGVSAAASSIHNFVKVRAKQKGEFTMNSPETRTAVALNPRPATTAPRPRFNLDA